MRKIIVSAFLTLDGVMEDPGGGEGFEHGGWSFPFFNEEYMKYKRDELFDSGALLLGRVTYQGFAAAWPSRKSDDDFADRMNSLPKYVVSSTLEELEWNNSILIKGNIAEALNELKRQPGQDILVAGSRQLVHMLMQHDLIDEYRLMVHPVVLGSGKRFFQEGTGKKVMTLVETKTFRSGIVVLTYRPDRKE
ncbi:dihydrofolate reductase family protein [Paenibacillus filicis]|uniref:Dihydrofolate reductase family protein n=1 Tax=Paenibacillus gyeongsangnamensis TaxID=3388067 RepID=A0ABT4Q4M3_9BACL|nr:dihydrofolate reductase family protein [Paenibacillus filicis]MCZ8511786.1 dihydrofolate reductase family protein [Paenibacillus filicis]